MFYILPLKYDLIIARIIVYYKDDNLGSERFYEIFCFIQFAVIESVFTTELFSKVAHFRYDL